MHAKKIRTIAYIPAQPHIFIMTNDTHSNKIDEPAVHITPLSLKELALKYGVSKRIIRQWLQPLTSEIGPRIGNYYTITQVKIIFDRLGMPCLCFTTIKLLANIYLCQYLLVDNSLFVVQNLTELI
jgi:hypothetical protein